MATKTKPKPKTATAAKKPSKTAAAKKTTKSPAKPKKAALADVSSPQKYSCLWRIMRVRNPRTKKVEEKKVWILIKDGNRTYQKFASQQTVIRQFRRIKQHAVMKVQSVSSQEFVYTVPTLLLLENQGYDVKSIEPTEAGSTKRVNPNKNYQDQYSRFNFVEEDVYAEFDHDAYDEIFAKREGSRFIGTVDMYATPVDSMPPVVDEETEEVAKAAKPKKTTPEPVESSIAKMDQDLAAKPEPEPSYTSNYSTYSPYTAPAETPSQEEPTPTYTEPTYYQPTVVEPVHEQSDDPEEKSVVINEPVYQDPIQEVTAQEELPQVEANPAPSYDEFVYQQQVAPADQETRQPAEPEVMSEVTPEPEPSYTSNYSTYSPYTAPAETPSQEEPTPTYTEPTSTPMAPEPTPLESSPSQSNETPDQVSTEEPAVQAESKSKSKNIIYWSVIGLIAVVLIITIILAIVLNA